MKHLPNELLYLLKVYNYIMHDIGLDRARSHAEDIRGFIAKADFLDPFPTVKEYLSEDKSIDDIITYIQRNERTYSLLGEWKDRELSNLFEEKGIELSGSFGFIENFSVKKEGNNAYFLLPCDICSSHKTVLINADITEDININKILWLEFYKSRDGMFLEIFDDNCSTFKISFCDFEVKKVFGSAEPLSKKCKTSCDAAVKMASFIYEKHKYDSSLLNENEKNLLPILEFLDGINSESLCGGYSEMAELFAEYGIDKGQKLLSSLAVCDSKKSGALIKKAARLLRSKKCAPLIEKLCADIISSQKSVEALPF